MPPDLLSGAALYLKALSICAADRPVSVGMGAMLYARIPNASIDRFAEREGIDDPDEFETFRRIIGVLDSEEVERLNKEANKKT